MTTITSAINLGSFTNTEVSVPFSSLLDILTLNIISESATTCTSPIGLIFHYVFICVHVGNTYIWVHLIVFRA